MSPILVSRVSPLSRAIALGLCLNFNLAAVAADAVVDADSADAGAQKLDRVEVQATRIDDAEGGRIGTKIDAPLRETPQSVSVVTREQMDIRGVRTVEEALRYSAGISLPYGYDQRYDWVSIRGFDSVYELFRDGLAMRGGTFTIARLDPFALERVEVLKGPAGVMYGSGTPGGLINLVSKRPDPDMRDQVYLTVGTNAHYEGGVDVGGELSDSWLYRFVGNYSDAETEVDYNHAQRFLLMPSARWRSDTTTIDLQATWQKLDSVEGSMPRLSSYARGALAALGVSYDFPRGRFAGDPDYDRYDNEYRSLAYTFEHRFNEQWTLRQNARFARQDLDYRTIYANGINFANPYEITRVAYLRDERSDSMTIDTSLQARFGQGNIKHTVLFGLDWRDLDNHEGGAYGCALPLNLVTPVYGQPFDNPAAPRDPANPCLPPPYFYSDADNYQIGFYVQDHIKFGEQWVLLAGGRFDKARNDTGSDEFEDEAFTGRSMWARAASRRTSVIAKASSRFTPTTSPTIVRSIPKPAVNSKSARAGSRLAAMCWSARRCSISESRTCW